MESLLKTHYIPADKQVCVGLVLCCIAVSPHCVNVHFGGRINQCYNKAVTCIVGLLWVFSPLPPWFYSATFVSFISVIT